MSTSVLAHTALVLSGALAAGGAFAAAPSASAAPAGVPTASPVACSSSACTVVARVDVDGDGRADTVSVTPTRAHGSVAQTLRVVTARKQVAQVAYATPYLHSSPTWFGAARIDGVTGNELVVRTGWGAHSQWFAVYSWRGGKLVAQRDPSSGSTEWVTDGAWMTTKGYTVQVAGGQRTLTAREYLRSEGDSHRFDGTAVTFTWRGGAWRRTSSSHVRVAETSPKVEAAYGWHVSGLPQD